MIPIAAGTIIAQLVMVAVTLLALYLIIKQAVAYGIVKAVHMLAGHGRSAGAAQLRADADAVLTLLRSGGFSESDHQ